MKNTLLWTRCFSCFQPEADQPLAEVCIYKPNSVARLNEIHFGQVDSYLSRI